MIERVFQWLLSADIQNQIVTQRDFQKILSQPSMRFPEVRMELTLQLMDTRRTIILHHHAREVDGTKVRYEVFGWKKTGILEDVESVRLCFPVEELEWFIGYVDTLVDERHLEHVRT